MAANTVDNCFAFAGASPLLDGGNNIDDGTSCSLSAAGLRSSNEPTRRPRWTQGQWRFHQQCCAHQRKPQRSTQFPWCQAAAARY